MVIGYSRSRLKRFALLLTLLSFWFTFETFFSYVTAAFKSQQQVFALGTNYLGIGRVVGPAALILLVYSTATERRSSVQFFAILVFVLTIAALLVLGGRGPFLATILPALLLLYYGIDVEILKGTIRVRRYVLIVVGLFVGIAAVVLSIGSVKVFATLYRLVMLLSELGGSASARLDMYERALTIWINHPVFGGGIGAWPVLTGWGDYKMYPHNLILEVLSEFGMVGLSLLILPLVYAFGYLKRHFDLRSDPWALLALMLVGNTFINAMFTGDLTDNRTFFAFLGFLVARGYSVTEERTTTRSLARAAARIREVTPSHVDDTQEAEPS
jgi:O-antigen ligase